MSTMGRGAVTVVLVGLATSGCYRHTVEVGGGAPYAPVIEERWENFWIGGLVGHVRVDVERMCPSGRAQIEVRQTFLNGLVTALTSGIYAPTTLRVRCEDGRRAALELTASDLEALAEDARFTRWVEEHSARADAQDR